MDDEADGEGHEDDDDETDDEELEQIAAPLLLLGEADLGHRGALRQGVHIVLGHGHAPILPRRSAAPGRPSGAPASGRLAIPVLLLREERVVVASLQQIDVLITHLALQGAQRDVPQEVARHGHHRHWG